MRERAPFKLFGIFGYPLAHSLSPAMQEAAFSKAGLKAFYLKFGLRPSSFRKVFGNLKRAPVVGFNVTVPYKEDAARYLDGLTPEARRVGAVNTVFRQGNRWTGANTDVYGFLESLRRDGRFRVRGKNALVFGAGGAARAVVYALASEGAASIVVFNRRAERAKKLVKDFRKIFPKTVFEALPLEQVALRKKLSEAHLAVNATSVGLKREDRPLVSAGAIPRAKGSKKILFFDLIYSPPETAFLKAAKKKGHRVLNGTGMLIFQGARAFEYWTGRPAPVSLMRRSLLKALATQAGRP